MRNHGQPRDGDVLMSLATTRTAITGPATDHRRHVADEHPVILQPLGIDGQSRQPPIFFPTLVQRPEATRQLVIALFAHLALGLVHRPAEILMAVARQRELPVET